MRIVSWLPPMPDIVFSLWSKLFIAPCTSSWGTIEYGTGTRRASLVYCMFHQRSINSFNFLIACAKTQLIYYSSKLFRSSCRDLLLAKQRALVSFFYRWWIKWNMIWKVMFFFVYVVILSEMGLTCWKTIPITQNNCFCLVQGYLLHLVHRISLHQKGNQTLHILFVISRHIN